VNWRAKSTWLIALFAICFSVFIPAGSASAHAGLEESEPKPSSWLATSPTEVVLYFDEPVGVVFARIKILDQEGNEVFEAKPIRDADDHTSPSSRLICVFNWNEFIRCHRSSEWKRFNATRTQ